MIGLAVATVLAVDGRSGASLVVALLSISFSFFVFTAQAQARAAKDRADLLLSMTPEMVCVIDQQGRFTVLSAAWAATLGFSETKMIGLPFAEFIHLEDREMTSSALTAGPSSLSPIDIRLLTESGDYVWVELRTSRSVNGCIYASARDATPLRKIKEEQAEAIRESGMFRQALDGLPCAFSIGDGHGLQYYSNKVALRHSGISEGRDSTADYSSSGRPHIESLVAANREVLATGEDREIEITVEYSDSARRNFRASIFPLYGPNEGKPISVCTVALDVTELQETNRGLRHAENMYRLIADNTSDVIWIYDTSLEKITYVSPAVERMTGYTPTEAARLTPEDIAGSPLISRPIRRSMLKRVLRHQRGQMQPAQFHENTFFRRKDGTFGYCAIAYALVWDESLKTTKIIGVANDTTDRALRDIHTKKLEQVVEQTPISILIVDQSGVIEYANPFTRVACGYSDEELIGNTLQFLHGEPASEPHFHNLWTALREGNSWRGEINCRTKNGTPLIERVVFSPVLSPSGIATHYVAVKEDITKHRQNEKALLESRLQVMAVFDSTDDLVWSVSPDDFRLVTFNPAFRRYFIENIGIEPTVGMPLSQRIKSGENDKWEEHYQETREMGYLSIETTSLVDQKTYAMSFNAMRVNGEIVGISVIGRDVTVQKNAILELEKSRQMLASSQSAARIGSFRFDIHRATWDGTPEAVRILGITNTNRGCSSWGDLIHEADRSATETRVSALVQERNERFDLYYRIQRPIDGKTRWVHSLGSFEYDDQGGLAYMLGTIQDITERRASETAKEESQALFHALAERFPTGIYVIKNGNFTYVNEALSGAIGRTPSGMIGTPAARILGPDAESTSNQDNAPLRKSISVAHQNGALVELEVLTARVAIKEGYVTVGNAIDVTARNLIEAKMRDQAMLLDIAADAIYVRSDSGIVSFWSKGAERMLGWSSDEVTGHHLDDIGILVSGSDHKGECPDVKNLPWTGERKLRAKNGRIVEVLTRLTKVIPGDEKGSSVFAINTDITEKKLYESRFYQAQRLESLGSLAVGIAHDLNNILSPIMMGLSVLRETTDCERSRQTLAVMEGSAIRGADIIKQILAFSKGGSVQRLTVDLRPMIVETVALAKQTFPRNIDIKLSIPADLWMAFSNNTQLHQVLMNLVVNARDAMPTGGVLQVIAENLSIDQNMAEKELAGRAGPYVKIKIIDTGTGIPEKCKSLIYEPFFTTKDAGAGTGLGLAVASSIMHSHEGMLRLVSSTAKGTCFEMLIPAIPSAGVAENKRPKINVMGRGETILFVDDEDPVRIVAGRILESGGYSSVMAADGLDGLTRFMEQRDIVALVVTDIMMPGMDGNTLAKLIRRAAPKTPIIGITGVSGASESIDPTTPFTTILGKPFTADDLLAAIKNAL